MDCSQYSSPITKKIFDECSASYCPVNIEDWDKDSKDSVVEFKNYKDKTDMCIQGDKRYKDA